MNELPIGITESGVIHTSEDEPFDLDTKFRMVKESGVYDYFDKTPPADQADKYIRCSEKYDLPVRTGGWYYVLGENDIAFHGVGQGAGGIGEAQCTLYILVRQIGVKESGEPGVSGADAVVNVELDATAMVQCVLTPGKARPSSVL